ncbi:MAG TPA: hypothetical protein VHI95_17130 [Acidimicrobiales bacterium]|jgi:hypothetical protein|nr:hypothetical protein [Acidimicrobiales bacterium]
MKYVEGFLRFWYDFIVGDDWRVAVGVVIAIAVTVFAVDRGANWWWLLPAAVGSLLTMTVLREAGQSHRR